MHTALFRNNTVKQNRLEKQNLKKKIEPQMYKRLEFFRAVGCNQIRTPHELNYAWNPWPTTKGGREELTKCLGSLWWEFTNKQHRQKAR